MWFHTGIPTARPLQAASAVLAAEGILLRYTDFGAHLDKASANIRQQAAGSHADEIETSMMLHIDPSSVDMKKAVKDFLARSQDDRRSARRRLTSQA